MNLTKISPLVLEDLQTVTEKSNDPSTKCGAVIYDGTHFVSRGCNNPRPEFQKFMEKDWRMKDFSIKDLVENRDFKINITEHAECACIRQKCGTIYSSATIYINSTPCLNCAIEIVEAGLKHVAIVGHYPDFENPHWGSSWKMALFYLAYHDVEVSFYDKTGKFMERVEASAVISFKRK